MEKTAKLTSSIDKNSKKSTVTKEKPTVVLPKKEAEKAIIEEEKKIEGILNEAWEKAEEIKKEKDLEKNKKRGNSNVSKPKWNERTTSWKKADFESVQALIDQAWEHKDDESAPKKIKSPKKKVV